MAFYKITDSDVVKILADSPLGKIVLTEDDLKLFFDKFDIDLKNLAVEDTAVGDNLGAFRSCSFLIVEMLCSLLVPIQLGFTLQVGEFTNLPVKKRYCYKQLWDYLTEGSSNRVAMLFGTRRTGKTVLMQQAINELLQSGVDQKKVAYITVQKDAVEGRIFCDYVRHLLSLGIDYLFIDELTYVNGNLNWTSILSDNTPGKMIVLAATDSLMFKELTRTILFERADVIRTTYISYCEFTYLYGLGLPNYLQSGGILRSSKSYLTQHELDVGEYLQYGLDYAGSAIIENITGCFNRFELWKRYPNLNQMTDARLRTFLFRWIQHYSEQLILRIFNRKLKSADIGNLMDCVSKKYADADVIYSEIENQLNRFLTERLNVKSFNDYSQDEVDEVFTLMKDLDCVEEVDGNIYLLPVALRYSYAYETIKILIEKFDSLCSNYSIPFNLEEARDIIQNCVEGILLESIIFIDLKRLGYFPRKWHDNRTNAEIDLILGNDLYEIKHNSRIALYQCRWLVYSETLQQLKPKSLNLLTLCPEEKDIVCTEYDVVQDVINHKKEHGESTKKAEEYLKEADKQTKYVVHCMNAEKFLVHQFNQKKQR